MSQDATLAAVIAAIEAETGRGGVTGATRVKELAVDSLVATKIVVRLRIALGVKVEMLTLFSDVTVAQFAEKVA